MVTPCPSFLVTNTTEATQQQQQQRYQKDEDLPRVEISKQKQFPRTGPAPPQIMRHLWPKCKAPHSDYRRKNMHFDIVIQHETSQFHRQQIIYFKYSSLYLFYIQQFLSANPKHLIYPSPPPSPLVTINLFPINIQLCVQFQTINLEQGCPEKLGFEMQSAI